MSKIHKFVICNPEFCIACNACVKACVKNAYVRGRLTKTRLEVLTREAGKMPNQCRQCDDAPCANVCPTSALRIANNCVELHEELCIGCKICTIACPYGCIYIGGEFPPSLKNESELELEIGCVSGVKSLAVKCDMCSGASTPACVDICPKGALLQIDPLNLEFKLGKKLKGDMKPFAEKILGMKMPEDLVLKGVEKPKKTETKPPETTASNTAENSAKASAIGSAKTDTAESVTEVIAKESTQNTASKVSVAKSEGE